MTIVIDLDGVLIKTHSVMKTRLAMSCRDLGITPQQYWVAYRAMRLQEMFSPERFWKYLPPQYSSKKRKIAQRVLQVFQRSEQYLYDDARRLLVWAHHRQMTVCVYTHGQPSVQKIKMQRLRRLYPWLRVVITTDPTKQNDRSRCVVGNDSWVWIDDSSIVAHEATKQHDGVFLYLRRSKTTPVVRGVKTIRTLSEARPIIKQILNQE